MALTESLRNLLGMQAPDFSLLGTDGEVHSLADFTDAKLLVIIFMCNHCPYVQAVLPRLNALADEYFDRGVAFVGINSNDTINYPEDSFQNMKRLPLMFHYLFDETQEIARAYKAVCTPDIYVFDTNRKLKYHGRVDDNWQNENAVKNRELRGALDVLLRGGLIPEEAQFPGLGCGIKWRN